MGGSGAAVRGKCVLWKLERSKQHLANSGFHGPEREDAAELDLL